MFLYYAYSIVYSPTKNTYIHIIMIRLLEGMLMNISEDVQSKLDVLFVASISIFIIVFWLLIMPGA